MILSHKNKFIFIKSFKTASTSLEIALSKYCGEKDIITPIVILKSSKRGDGFLTLEQKFYLYFIFFVK